MKTTIKALSALLVLTALSFGAVVLTTPVAQADPEITLYHVWCGACGDPCDSQCDPYWRPFAGARCYVVGCQPGVSCSYQCFSVG